MRGTLSFQKPSRARHAVPRWGRRCTGAGLGGSACGTDPGAFISRRQWSSGAFVGFADGLAGGPAATGLQPHAGAGAAHLHWWNSCRNGAGLSASGGCVRKNYRPVKAARCCQYAVKLSWVAGALALALAANGARMPSTADDVLAEIRSAALRVASVLLRRYGLDSLSVMRQWYYAHVGLRKCLNANQICRSIAEKVVNNQ